MRGLFFWARLWEMTLCNTITIFIMRNLNSRLPRRRQANPMDQFDRLPSELRRWIANAALPWSSASCLKIWRSAQRSGASLPQIYARLEQAEQRMLAKEKGPAMRGL